MQEVLLNFGGSAITNVVIDGTAYFVGNDVADILGYSDLYNAVRRHVNEEDKIKKVIFYKGQKRKVTLINDLGVLDLVSKSKLESAQQFKKWIVREVLPSIFNYGMYLTPEARKLKDEAPKEFEAMYLKMKEDLEHSEKARARVEKSNEELLENSTRLTEDNTRLGLDNLELRKENVSNIATINNLSDTLNRTNHKLKSVEDTNSHVASVLQHSELHIYYSIFMSNIVSDMYVANLADLTKGTDIEIGRNNLYQILREMGLLKLTITHDNVATEYGKKEGYVYDVEVTPKRRTLPFMKYTKPMITQKGIALLFKELSSRRNKTLKNVFK